jgi:hypothetical protein
LSWEERQRRIVTTVTAEETRGQYNYLTPTICVEVKALQCTVALRCVFNFILTFWTQHTHKYNSSRLISSRPKSIQKVPFKTSASCHFLISCHEPQICRNVPKISVWTRSVTTHTQTVVISSQFYAR